MRLLPLTLLLTACGDPAANVHSLELKVINEGFSPHFEVTLSRIGQSENCPVPARAVVTANGAPLTAPSRGPLGPEPCNTVWYSKDLSPLEKGELILEYAFQTVRLQAHYTYVGHLRKLVVTSGAVVHDGDLVFGTYQSPAADLPAVAVAFLYRRDLSWSAVLTGPVTDGKWQVQLPVGLRKGAGWVGVWGYAAPPAVTRCDFGECTVLPAQGLIVNGQVDATVK